MSAIALWVAGAAAIGASGLVLTELLVRWWLRHRNAYYVWAPGFRRMLWLDEDAVPGAAPTARFEVNSEGERGDEPPPPNESVFRILVAGGSAAECMLLDTWTSWPGRLQRLLESDENRRALGGVARVHVGNVGKSDVDSEALERMLSRILRGHPPLDVIITFVGASNVCRWLAAGAPADRAAPPLAEEELFDRRPTGPFGWQPRRTALAETVRRGRLRFLRPIEERQRAGKFMTRMRVMRSRARMRSAVPDPAAMLDSYENALRLALRTAMRHSKRVIVARQPWFDKSCCTPEEETRLWHGALGDAFSADVTEFVTHGVLCSLMSQLDQRTVAVVQELGVEQIDLRPVVESTLTSYYDFCHLTVAGAAKVAEAIAGRILERASSPPRASSRSEHTLAR